MKTTRLLALAQQLPHPDASDMIRDFTRAKTCDSPFMGWVKATVGDADPQAFSFKARAY